MKWELWKRGLFVALLTGLLTAGAGLSAGGSLKSCLAVLGVCIAKDGVLYLMQHPAPLGDEDGGQAVPVKINNQNPS